MRLGAAVALVAAVWVGVSLGAWALGAANLFTSLGIGQVAFAAVLVWVLLRR